MKGLPPILDKYRNNNIKRRYERCPLERIEREKEERIYEGFCYNWIKENELDSKNKASLHHHLG